MFNRSAVLTLVLSPLLALGCAAPRGTDSPLVDAEPESESRATAAFVADGPSARELEDHYSLAMSAFGSGHYEEAAQMFAALLLRLPRDPGSDDLRHLLVQHIGWALLGSHDVGQDAGTTPPALDRGERMLEAYLVQHETLLPEAEAPRIDIYTLLAEYGLRRGSEPPTDASVRLEALVKATVTQIVVGDSTDQDRHANRDQRVRNIEVDTRRIQWATPDHPRVDAFFRDIRDLGPTLFENPGGPLNPTRVLVRGLVGTKTRTTDAGRRARAILVAARSDLERCYEQAIGRGADLVERVDLDLAWGGRALGTIGLEAETGLDVEASTCVRAAIREADRGQGGEIPRETVAALHLTFFVQGQGRRVDGEEFEFNQGVSAFDQINAVLGSNPLGEHGW